MNITRAIEILVDHTPKEPPYFDPPFVEALKLGREALKEVKKARDGDPALDGELLPGETDA